MKNTKDLFSNIILISILLIISILIFYLFFYPDIHPKPSQNKESAPENSKQYILEETKFKGKGVYIIEQSAKIRLEPKSNATVLEEKTKGERLIVEGAWGDWFEVSLDSEKKGWILREQVSDRKPPQKIPDSHPPVQVETQEKTVAVDQVRAELDNLVANLNQLSQQQFSQEMVSGFEITENGAKLIMYLKDAWYFLPPIQKQATANVIAFQYGKLACQYNVRPECNQNDFPTITYLNSKGKEIARISSNQPLQVFE